MKRYWFINNGYVRNNLYHISTARDGMTAGVANGEMLPWLGVCPALSFSINGETFCINFLIIAPEG
jgi:hypothetical protein